MAAIKMIQPQQIKKLWAVSRALGLGRDELYAMADTGSLHQLTEEQAAEVLTRLKAMQKHNAPPPKSAKIYREVAGMATAGQQRKVLYLMYQLETYSPGSAAYGERLRGIIRKVLGLDVLPREEFRWISFEDCNKLIEAMKRYVATAKKKTGGGG